MKILVIGSGGREHALTWKIARSPIVEKIYCAPGNPGTEELAENIPVSSNDLDGLLNFAQKERIDLTVVGPEDPLVAGIVDLFEEQSLPIFGPGKSAARLEGSKSFAKDIMQKHGIPTAEYRVFTDVSAVSDYVKTQTAYPLVLKADGLAAGKGVIICQNQSEALQWIDLIMKEQKFGTAGSSLVIEEFLQGDEVSIFAICDGADYVLLAPSQDHKKVFDNDQGKNTGGMGAYAPAPLADAGFMSAVEEDIIKRSLEAVRSECAPYKGLLYFGLIVTADGPKVLEYNCRFGDPETEVVLPMLENDLVPLMMASVTGELRNQTASLRAGSAIDVVLASGGYPDAYQKGYPIAGLENLDNDIIIFHAGTTRKETGLLTAGGRVLNVVAVGEDLKSARETVYENIKRISFRDMHYRNDIGARAL